MGRTARTELLSPQPRAPPSTCSEGRLNCTDLPCPGTYPARREVRRSSQGGRKGRGCRRDRRAPVPTGAPYSAWQLVPVVGVDSLLPALQGPDKDPLQGLRLSRSSARRVPVPWEAEEAGPQHQSETCPSPSTCPGELPSRVCSRPSKLGHPGLLRHMILSSWHSGRRLEPMGTVVSL